MKTKPTKHKEENTFKFQSFSERLSKINVDVVHRIDLKRNAVPEDTETFFYECLEKWSDLNCTEGYTKFCRLLGKDVQSLPQVLFHKDRILDLLCEHINLDNKLYLEPLLELVVALAKDIQSDFYPKFPSFFKQLIDLIQDKDAQIVEWTFTTLAFLYKYQWRALVKDIHHVYELQLPLLAPDKPDHIQLFASESFSFIGRKISNKPSFVNLVLSKLRKNPGDSLGVGQLLFQIIKGVKNQFHSNLDVYLPLFLKSVIDIKDSVQNDPVFQAISQCFLLMAKHTTATYAELAWKLLLKKIEDCNACGLFGLLLLLHQWVSFKEGALIGDIVSIANTLASLIKADLSDDEQLTTAETTANLMLCSKTKLPLEQFSRLGLLIFSSQWNVRTILAFSTQVSSHELFESHLLPHYLSFCHSRSKLGPEVQELLLENLSLLIAKKTSLPKTGHEIARYKTYPMEFTFAMRKTQDSASVPQVVERILQNGLEQMITEKFKVFVSALVCLPNVRPLENERIKSILRRILEEVGESLDRLKDDDDDDGEPKSKRLKKKELGVDFVEKLGLVASLAILAGSHSSPDMTEIIPFESARKWFQHERTSTNVFFLRALDVFLTRLHQSGRENFFTFEVLNQLHRDMGMNVTSAYREVRLLTLHMFSLFSLPLPAPPENISPTPIFDICLQAELVPVTLKDHREKLKILQKLETDRIVYSLPVGGAYAQVPLQYLLSQLFINFRPIWDPVLKLIESHAYHMEAAEFWSTYFSFMQRVRREQVDEMKDPSAQVEYLNLSIQHERLDFAHVRCLLWQGLSRFGAIVNKQQSQVVSLFLEFWNEEYVSADGTVASFQNLINNSEDEDDINDEGENGKTLNRKKLVQLLTSHLSAIAAFKQPGGLHREAEVTSVLHKLLSHRLTEVQKLALDCLANYGFPHLNPYIENLYRLLDDKTFRNELTLFSMDQTTSLVRPEHRAGLSPILLRLLYGKMFNKGGHNAAGKQNIQHRQALILRYVAGFSDTEIDTFLELVFDTFQTYRSDQDIYERVVQMMKESDPTRAFPLKRLQGALVMMGTIFAKLGNLMQPTLPKLLEILLCMCAHVIGLIGKRSDLGSRHLTQLKSLRTLGLERIAQFFVKFERYPWTATELEALFHVCVWPQLEQLPIEAIHSPTPLLKLLQVWSQNPRYFVLFGKHHPDRKDLTILPPLLALLAGGKAQPIVCSFIMDIVDKLVTIADYGTRVADEDEDADVYEEPIHLKPNFCADLPQIANLKDGAEKPNLGSLLLIPHISPVLKHLRSVINRGLSARDLNILMRISEFITDSNLSSELSRLIVPAIKAKSGTSRTAASEEILTQYLNTLSYLLVTASDPQSFIGLVAPLFGCVEGRSARDALCNVLNVIERRDSSRESLGRIASSLNAWDPKRIDQPDFDKRLTIHKEINATLTNGKQPTTDMIYVVLYNCFYFVRKVDDSSLRDSASFTLQQMAAAFQRFQYGKSVLSGHFLPQLRLLIRSKNETVRHEGVLILGETVTHCSSLNSSIANLRRLRKAGDAELDFFENSRHLQTHRRSRALLRLAGILKSDRTCISGDTITQFLLPLATCYLFDEAYENHNHLVDASYDCINAIARCLSWYNYDKLLRFFLSYMTRQVQFQKQAVKAVVAILNAFHFDLRNSQFKSKPRVEETSDDPVSPDSTTDPVPQANETPTANSNLSTELPEMAEETEDETSDLSVESATKIHSIIVRQLLPQLNKILTARSKRDSQHKAVKDHFPEDDEILRVPIALALVHLLKNLPAGALERSLPGMFSKVCTFLKSRCDSVRETARDTLIRMMTALGPEHLVTLLEAAEPIMQRGFQVHVYIFTVHAILVKLVETNQMKVGCLDSVVHLLVEICKKELQGDTAEEKEVAQIVSKIKEARGIKAYDTLNIIAKYVSQSSLLPLVLPLKELMATTKSYKMMRKVEECLQNIATGLAMNSGLTPEQLFIFVHGVVSLSIPQLKLPVEKPKESEENFSINGKPLRSDSFIIAPEPKRKSAVQPATSVQTYKSAYITNSHLFVEFGFLTLQLLLKQEKGRDKNRLSMLDPFVPIANESLLSQHSKLVALALRCICQLLRMPLPSVEEYAPKISTSIFTLLHKYSGNASGDTFEMIQTAFKAVTVLIKHVTKHTINTDQLRVLLTYAEQALNDPTQQSIGFGVLKAILRRKLNLDELPEIMFRVCQLSVTSEAGPVRAQCKQVVLKYMIEYPLGKKILRYLEFFLGQLEFEKEIGRLSAIEFMASIFNTFPKNLLSQQSTLFLVTLSTRLINETSTSCLKAVAAALRILIQRLNTKTSTVMFEICLKWLRDENLAHKRLAAQLCGIFAAAEGSNFEFRTKEVLTEFIKLLEPSDGDKEDRDSDLLLIQTFYAIIKITQHCPAALQNVDHIDLTDELWTRIIHHLLHPHVWIRTLGARLVGILLGWHKVDEVAARVSMLESSDEVNRTFLLSEHVSSRLRSLASESVAQLQSNQLDNQLAEQVVKNLVFIAKVANRLPAAKQEQEIGSTAPTLPWLTGKLRREINAEVALRPKFTIKRLSVFKWMAAVAVDLNQVAGKEGLIGVLKFFVPPLTRDINDDGAPEDVRNMAQEVADLIKGFVGTEAYSEAVVAANRILAVRRRDRNAARKADSVIRPERTAKLRIKKHLAKRVAKKVKIAKLKGKRLKLKDLAFATT